MKLENLRVGDILYKSKVTCQCCGIGFYPVVEVGTRVVRGDQKKFVRLAHPGERNYLYWLPELVTGKFILYEQEDAPGDIPAPSVAPAPFGAGPPSNGRER